MRQSGSDYGISQPDWDAAKLEARDVMIAVARRKSLIFYSDLVGKITTVAFDYHDVRLNGLLEDVSIDEDEQGRGMLSAVVVYKTGEAKGQPGPGFFELAAKLGRRTGDKERCWSEEVARVYEHWARRTSR